MLCSSTFLYAQKTDIITTEQGGKVIGDIKKFDRGRLEIKTKEMGTLNIEWAHIISIQSKKRYDIETAWGQHFFGSLEAVEEARKLKIITETGHAILAFVDVVRLHPLESKFWSRVKGYIDAGFSYQSSNSFAELTLGSEVSYHGTKWTNLFRLETYRRTQKEGAQTRRNNLAYHLERVFKDRWSGDLFVTLEQNDELELDLRALFGIGWGKHFIQNNQMLFQAFAGLDFVQVKRLGDAVFTTNYEALIGSRFDAFRFSSPKIDLTAYLTVFLNLTEFGRLRTDFNTRLRYEVLHDFYVGLTVFSKIDADFREGGDKVNDFGINMTISWGFR